MRVTALAFVTALAPRLLLLAHHPDNVGLDGFQRWAGRDWLLGPRDRHDGCEILQGVTPLRHGADFFCAAWPADSGREEQCTGVLTWDGHRYVVSETGVARAPTEAPLVR